MPGWGLPSHQKYEADGGRGVADLIAELQGSIQAERDLTTLLTAQLLFWMLAAPDGHAKNFSLRILPLGRYALTPLYDVMSIWPIDGNGPNQFSIFKAKMAMAALGKNRHYHVKDNQRRHFNHMAAKYFNLSDTEVEIESVPARTPHAIEAVGRRLRAGFPMRLAESIFARS